MLLLFTMYLTIVAIEHGLLKKIWPMVSNNTKSMTNCHIKQTKITFTHRARSLDHSPFLLKRTNKIFADFHINTLRDCFTQDNF